MGIRDWFSRGGQKAPPHVVQNILSMVAGEASDAAVAAISKGLSDDDVVKATVRVASRALGGPLLSATDEDCLAWLANDREFRKAVLSVVKTALQASSSGGKVPASRADALQAALNRYASRVSQRTTERAFEP